MKIQRNQRSGKKAIIASLSIAVAAIFGYLALNYQASDDSLVLAGIQADCGPDEAIFFSDAYFYGKNLTMHANGFNDAPASFLSIFLCNDCISSFKIGKNVRARLCQNTNCAGEDSRWDSAIDIVGPYTVNQLEDINDWISHIKLFPYNPDEEIFVQAFSLPEYGVGHAGLFPLGNFSSPDILKKHLNLPGNHGSISGMVVPNGYVAIIYDKDY